jgi:integrase
MNMMAAIEVDGATSCDWRMGEMIWSAIRFGGLLDQRDWPSWAAGVQRDIAAVGPLISVELAQAGNRGAGRWFADPITAVLIARWHREGLMLPEGADAESCLALFLSTRGEQIDQVVQASRDAWEFRLPGLLLAYACGDVPASSVRRSTWERVVYGPSTPDEPMASPVAEVDRAPTANWMRDELTLLRRAARAPTYLRGRRAMIYRKAIAAGQIEALGVSASPIRTALRRWVAFALRHEGGRASKGYSPSTAEGYLRALTGVFGGCDDCPLTANARVVADHVLAALLAKEGRPQVEAVKAVRSFLKFANIHRSDPVEVGLDEFGIDQVFHADLVLPDAYDRARAALERAGNADLADLLTLMFRAGLRLDEAVALRAGDVCIHGARVELIVEANDERALKTKTSRRILPLDVLLEPSELENLRDRALTRQAASFDDGEAWLFGHDLAISPPDRRPIARQLDRVVAAAAGSERVGHTHLRHSFASFLLATLLLPQDVAQPAVPDRLRSVVSPKRFFRVADRLLGDQRLGAGALHAVSQLMGHTGPHTTLRHYCHLLDLSLALHCARPSAMGMASRGWVRDLLDVGSDAARKAKSRAALPIRSTAAGVRPIAVRPCATAMLGGMPEVGLMIADSQLLGAGVKRLTRDLSRNLTAHMLEVEFPSRRASAEMHFHHGNAYEAVERPRGADGYRVPWRRLDMAQQGAQPALPAAVEYARFVDQLLHLSRRPTRAEGEALGLVVERFRAGRHDIRLRRLRDAEAFVRLLGVMGLNVGEVRLSLTSGRGSGVASDQIHRFLGDRSAMPQLAGRGGWRGSMVVRLQPQGFDHPILAVKATRFALAALHAYVIATGRRT